MGLRASSKLSKIEGRREAKQLEGTRLAPRGYIPICAGVNNDTKRSIIHTAALTDADFMQLLCKSGEEFRFPGEGVLSIPFAAEDFKYRITRASKMRILRAKPGQRSGVVAVYPYCEAN